MHHRTKDFFFVLSDWNYFSLWLHLVSLSTVIVHLRLHALLQSESALLSADCGLSCQCTYNVMKFQYSSGKCSLAFI